MVTPIGVSIYRHGQTETLFSERETIVAAGAYGSPHILMLSGIGPAGRTQLVWYSCGRRSSGWNQPAGPSAAADELSHGRAISLRGWIT